LPGVSGQSSSAMSIAPKRVFRHADAWLLDYPHEAGNDEVEGSRFQCSLGARCNQKQSSKHCPARGEVLIEAVARSSSLDPANLCWSRFHLQKWQPFSSKRSAAGEDSWLD
jgi:hypothetical protein